MYRGLLICVAVSWVLCCDVSFLIDVCVCRSLRGSRGGLGRGAVWIVAWWYSTLVCLER